MNVRVHQLDSDTVVIILPGVDGSVDGYQDKYIRMAEKIVMNQQKAVVRVSNDFITSFHWEDNFRQAIDYVNNNSQKLFNKDRVNIEVISHSAGASVAAWLAWEYPNITQLVLINTAAKLQPERILGGLGKYKNKAQLVYGSEDPSIDFIQELPSTFEVHTVQNADLYFSGDHLETFINLGDLLNQ